MSIKTKVKRAMRRNFSKIMVIPLLTMSGVIANIDSLAFDYPANADITTRHSRLLYPASSFAPAKHSIMRVTAYNVGDPFQADADPCIGAGNEDLCRALAQGEKICAANFVPLNTYLYIQNHGIYRVADRMNRRFQNSVDIAMQPHQKDKAVEFGVQNLVVSVVDWAGLIPRGVRG